MNIVQLYLAYFSADIIFKKIYKNIYVGLSENRFF